jgi:nucleoside-diphosphate-sugar epimerase
LIHWTETTKAGGQIGKPIAEQLVQGGKHTVTAITRAGSKSNIAPGTKAVSVDYNNQASIVAALKGNEFLLITLALGAPEDTQRKLVEAAAKAGVQYVLTNAYGVDVYGKPGLQDALPVGKAIVENIEHAAHSGLTWFSMFTGPWYEYSLSYGADLLGIDKKNRTATFFDDGKKPIKFTTISQLVRAAVALLNLKVLPDNKNDKSVTLSQFFNRPVYVSSFHPSQADILESIKRVTGKEESEWRVSYESGKERYEDGMKLISEGNPAGFAKAIFASPHTTFRPTFLARNHSTFVHNNVSKLTAYCTTGNLWRQDY